jgi:hypothetical protein
MNTNLAARRRTALDRGARFIWDKAINTKGQVTGYYGFVMIPSGTCFAAGVHATEDRTMDAMVSIAEREL